MNDSPKEMACLNRAHIWEGLIGFCEEMERGEIEAKVGRSDADPSGMVSSFSDPGGAPSLKRPKTGRTRKDHRREACATNRKPKTENRKQLLKGMSRAVARDLELIS